MIYIRNGLIQNSPGEKPIKKASNSGEKFRGSPAAPIIDISPYAGFCGGVNRTIKIIDRLRAEHPGKKINLLGNIVHNEIVLARLKRRGFRTIHDFRRAKNGLLVIQSHGIPAALHEEIRASGIEYVDTTCPMVKGIHAKTRKLARDGFRPVIIGDRRHEEVRGIAGQVDDALIIGSPGEADPAVLRRIPRAGVVVQSTFIRAEADRILRKLRRYIPEVRFENTICKPTSDRQRDAGVRASRYDCVIVIGSEKSANTRNLMSIVRARNPRTVLVVRPEDVDSLRLRSGKSVYVLSGASTPMDVIERTVARLRRRIRRKAS